MSRMGKRLVALLIWTGIGILIGMQLGGGQFAPSGDGKGEVREERQGAVPPEGSGWGGIRQQPPESVAKAEPEPEPEPKFEPLPRDILLPDRSSPPADVLADKTAGLLQQLSDQSIRWVVSMFGSIAE